MGILTRGEKREDTEGENKHLEFIKMNKYAQREGRNGRGQKIDNGKQRSAGRANLIHF